MPNPSVGLGTPPERLRASVSELKPLDWRANARGRCVLPRQMTRGTSMRKSLLEDAGAGETNRAMPFQSVNAVCEAEAAPLQRACTSTPLTGAPEAFAIITAAAALPSSRRAATASAYRGGGGL